MTAPDDPARDELARVIMRGVHRRISGPPISSLVFDAVADDVLAHLASVVSRRDADLRTRIEADIADADWYLLPSATGYRVKAVLVDTLARALDGDTREDGHA